MTILLPASLLITPHGKNGREDKVRLMCFHQSSPTASKQMSLCTTMVFIALAHVLYLLTTMVVISQSSLSNTRRILSSIYRAHIETDFTEGLATQSKDH